MRYFFIDFENVKSDGMAGVASLGEDDIVRIFYSKDAQTMTFGLHRRLTETKAQVEYARISDNIKTSAKNALDIRLMDELNEIMKKDSKSEYFIVSCDKDYDGFVKAYSDKNYKIKKIVTINDWRKEKEVSKVPENKVEAVKGSKKKTTEKIDMEKRNSNVKINEAKNNVNTKSKNKNHRNGTNDKGKLGDDINEYKELRKKRVGELLAKTNIPIADKKEILEIVDLTYGESGKMIDMFVQKYGEEKKQKIWEVIKSAF